jgi:hypothetical protein
MKLFSQQQRKNPSKMLKRNKEKTRGNEWKTVPRDWVLEKASRGLLFAFVLLPTAIICLESFSMMKALTEPPSCTLLPNSNKWVASVRFSPDTGITSFAEPFLNFAADTLEGLRCGFLPVEQQCPIATAPASQTS